MGVITEFLAVIFKSIEAVRIIINSDNVEGYISALILYAVRIYKSVMTVGVKFFELACRLEIISGECACESSLLLSSCSKVFEALRLQVFVYRGDI